MTITSLACQTIWLCRMLSKLKNKQKGLTKILCDSKFAIALTKNLTFHGKSKQTSIKFHYFKELCEKWTWVLYIRRSSCKYFYKATKVGCDWEVEDNVWCDWVYSSI